MKMDLISFEKIFLVLFKYFRNWLLNTGEKQYKQADGDRLIEVKITVIKENEIQVFDNRPLNTGWPLNTMLPNTGSTAQVGTSRSI